MPKLTCIDHVQLAIPRGGEDAARAMFVGLLGLAEMPKPENLQKRGGCWFKGDNVFVHCGVDPNFQPATKAHIAFRVDDLDALAASLAGEGYKVVWDDELADEKRFYANDPFGNRLEFMADLSAGQPPRAQA
jgi:catechol 2,3-dioxygenase-like lactoylglutathione lyase family enzyme